MRVLIKSVKSVSIKSLHTLAYRRTFFSSRTTSNLTHSKKSQVNYLVGLFLLVFFLLIILLFIFNVGSIARDSAWEKTCADSTRAHSYFGTPINCPTKEIKIKTNNQDKARRDVAEALATCWSIHGAGQYNLYTAQEGNFCTICYLVTLDGPDLTHLSNYLYTHRTKVAGKSQYYSDYLTPGTQMPVLNEKDDSISSNTRYAIIYSHMKNLDYVTLYGLRAAPVGSGALLGASFLLISNPVGWVAMFAGAGMGIIIQQFEVYNHFVLSTADTNAIPGIALLPYEPETLSKMGCTRVEQVLR